MGTFEKVRKFMSKPTGESLRKANGQKAIDELEAKRAERERKAELDHVERLQQIESPLAEAAAKAAGLYNPGKSQEAIVFEEPELSEVEDTAPHDDEYHIPADVEPDVSKSEEVNVDDNEKIAA